MSSASVWEIAIKAALGRLDIELDDLEGAIVRNGFSHYRSSTGMRWWSVAFPLFTATRSIACSSLKQPWKLRIISHDRVFERYGLGAQGLPPIII